MNSDRRAISQVGNTAIYLDPESLKQFGGRLASLSRFEFSLALLLKALATALLAFAILVTFLLGKGLSLGPVSGVLLSAAIFSFCYSNYLRRNRSSFEQVMQQNLRSVGKSVEISIDTVLDHSSRIIFDQAFNTADPLKVIIDKTLASHDVAKYLHRLGVSSEELAAIYKQVNWDNFFSHLVNVAIDFGEELITVDAIFITLLIDVWVEELQSKGILKSDIQSVYVWLKQQKLKRSYRALWQQQSMINPKESTNRGFTSVYGPNIEQNTTDLTRIAASGKFELAIGRSNEIAEILNLLSLSAGSSVLLVHQNGAGVETILSDIAVRMVVEDVPKQLQDRRLISLNLTKLYAQTQDLATFKAKIQSILEEVARNKFMVLVLSEFEQIFNIESSSSAEVLNLIINYIGRTKIPVIATVTNESFNRYIQPQSTLSSNFRVVKLTPLSTELTMQVLADRLPELEKTYAVTIEFPAVKQLLQLLPKLPSELALPGKAVQILEEVAAISPGQGRSHITAEYISQFVSGKIGVNVGSIGADESKTLLELESRMHERIVGQVEAIAAVANSLQRARAGIVAGSRPIASFLFYGPTGVGKTEVARTLSALYFGGEKAMIRLDMSEFQSAESTTKLTGSYQNGEFVGGQLTEAVRQKPHCLLLLDELEKANPKVLDLFLQVLDEGSLTDALGRSVDFTNAIIIATSNASSKEIAEDFAAGKSYEEVRERTQPKLREVYRIEFLNRFDRIIMFTPLSPEDMDLVVGKFVTELKQKMLEKGIELEVPADVVKNLAASSYDATFGARQARRAVQDKLESKIAEQIIAGKLRSGQRIIFEAIDKLTVV